jgi:hypothetical protein
VTEGFTSAAKSRRRSVRILKWKCICRLWKNVARYNYMEKVLWYELIDRRRVPKGLQPLSRFRQSLLAGQLLWIPEGFTSNVESVK